MNKVSPKRYIPTVGQGQTAADYKNILKKNPFKKRERILSNKAREKMPNMLDWKNFSSSTRKKRGKYRKVDMPVSPVVKQHPQKNNRKDKNFTESRQEIPPSFPPSFPPSSPPTFSTSFKAVPISTYSLVSLLFLLASLGLLLYATYIGTETQRISGLIRVATQELYAAEEAYARYRENLEGYTSGFWTELNNGSMRKVSAKDITVVDFSQTEESRSSSTMIADKRAAKQSDEQSTANSVGDALDAALADGNIDFDNEKERAIAFKKVMQESAWDLPPRSKINLD